MVNCEKSYKLLCKCVLAWEALCDFTYYQYPETFSYVSIAEFCESLAYLSHKNTTPVVLLEITRSICRTSLNRYMFVCFYQV